MALAFLMSVLLVLPAFAVDVIWMTLPNGPRTITNGQGVQQEGGFDNWVVGGGSGYNQFKLRSHKSGGSARLEDEYGSLEMDGEWEMGWGTTGLTNGTYSIVAYLETTWDMGVTYQEIENAGQGSQTIQAP